MRAASAVYGEGGRSLDDPAELYHEASKLHPSTLARVARGVRLLETRAELRASAARAVRRRLERPRFRLPEPVPLDVPFQQLLAARRSVQSFAAVPLPLARLSALLEAGYGVTRRGERSDCPDLRTVPSGGALYPLDVYCASLRVERLARGIYHYDPPLRELALVCPGVDGLGPAFVGKGPPEGCAVVLIVAASFWRTRFKYGLRGYRFALLEAGHLAQNLLLAAVALGLGALPVGAFYDGRLDELLGLDGVDESVLYAVCVGASPGPAG